MRSTHAVLVLVGLLAAQLAAAQARSKGKGKLEEPPAPAPAVAEPAPVVTPAPAPAPAPAPRPAAPMVAEDQKPRLAVVNLQAQGVPATQAAALTDALVAALSSRGLFEVIAPRDIEAVLGVERQKQLLGVCDAEPDACGASLGDSLAAPFLLSGQLSRIGTAFQLTLQTVDTRKGKAVGRSNHLAPSLEALQQVVPYAAAEATGSPLPPPPSRVLPITLLAAGGATFLAGAAYGVITLTQQSQLNDELCPGGVPETGRCTGMALRERSFYLAQDVVLTRQKWLAAGLMAGGALLAALGVVLMPAPDDRGRIAAVVVPTLDGLALTGRFW